MPCKNLIHHHIGKHDRGVLRFILLSEDVKNPLNNTYALWEGTHRSQTHPLIVLTPLHCYRYVAATAPSDIPITGSFMVQIVYPIVSEWVLSTVSGCDNVSNALVGKNSWADKVNECMCMCVCMWGLLCVHRVCF